MDNLLKDLKDSGQLEDFKAYDFNKVEGYNKEDWIRELTETVSCGHSLLGSCIIPCPWCGVYGFYGPKIVPNKIIRACKWCGIWQKQNGEFFRAIGLICQDCNMGTETEKNLDKPCQSCGQKMTPIKWPIEYKDTYYDKENQEMNPYAIRKEIYKIHGYSLYGFKISEQLINLMTNA